MNLKNLKRKELKKMKTRSNMPLYVVECDNVKTLSNSQIDLLRCGDYLVKKDASGEHAYKVTYKSDTGMCITYHDAYCVETQSYDKVGDNWVYNSEDKTIIAEPSMENIVDKDGHKRFVEGDITINTTFATKCEVAYKKWSLSGTHLMLVLAGTLKNGSVFANSDELCVITLPDWLIDKVHIVFGTNWIEVQNPQAYSTEWQTQTFSCTLGKFDNPKRLKILKNGSLTLSSDKSFRVQFDLLIDNE